MIAINKLKAALRRIRDGDVQRTDGELSHSKLCKEADVSRSHYYRETEFHDLVCRVISGNLDIKEVNLDIDGIEKVKDESDRETERNKRGEVPDDDTPINIRDKNRELQSENTRLKREIKKVKDDAEKELDQARQKVYILSRLVEKREEQLAKVKRDLSKCKENSGKGLKVVK